jgi:isoleucyl-tRNA synthetase
MDMATLCITSGITFADSDAPADAYRLEDVAGVAVIIEKASGEKCERCWKVLDEIGTDSEHETLCHRCADAVRHSNAAAA